MLQPLDDRAQELEEAASQPSISRVEEGEDNLQPLLEEVSGDELDHLLNVSRLQF